MENACVLVNLFSVLAIMLRLLNVSFDLQSTVFAVLICKFSSV